MQKCLYIPREINQSYILIWQRDEFICMVLPLGIFFITFSFLGLILSLVGVVFAAMSFKKVKVNRPCGYIRHLILYNFPKNKSNSLYSRSLAFPPSSLRYFAG